MFRILRPVLRPMLHWGAALLACAPQLALAQSCNAFGNAPQRFISSTAPTCPQGGTQLLQSNGAAWTDGDGHARYACLWTPAAVPKKLPLIVYIHPSLSTADSVANSTNILSGLSTADLTGDPSRPGFLLLAPQGRSTTHLYEWPDNQGTGWDIWYRQFDAAGRVTVGGVSYPENVDAATLDHFIQQVVATGLVDTNRIYLTGWSNGTSMAYVYALNRPGIAAVSVYSGGDPYAAYVDPCQQTPVAGTPQNIAQIQILSPEVPSYQVHNYCDIGGSCPNVQRFMSRLRAQGSPASDQTIYGDQSATSPASLCSPLCGTNPDGGGSVNPTGTLNHIRWPDDWTATMAVFLDDHPLDGAGRFCFAGMQLLM